MRRFSNFALNDKCLEFVEEFKYLGHMLGSVGLYNDAIRRVEKLFNRLMGRFSPCSLYVKRDCLKRSICICTMLRYDLNTV